MSTAPALAALAPEVPWAEWWPTFRATYERAPAYEAQHVTILGPTRTGKSVLGAQIANLNPYVFALLSKPKDEPMRRLLRSQGYRRVAELPEPQLCRRAAIWPRYTGLESKATQRAVFARAMDEAFRAGIWHGFVDEGHYVCEPRHLGLAERVRIWYQQGSSNGNGLILCAQRPAWIPRDAYSAARHVFLFGTNDTQDLRAIGGLNGADERTVRAIVAGLGKTSHKFLHVDTGTGTMVVSKYQPH